MAKERVKMPNEVAKDEATHDVITYSYRRKSHGVIYHYGNLADAVCAAKVMVIMNWVWSVVVWDVKAKKVVWRPEP